MGEEQQGDRKRKITFGIMGGGWRAEFYLRIAQALPEEFAVSEIWMRDEAKAREMESRWGIKTTSDLDGFLGRRDFSFVVLTLSRSVAAEYIAKLAGMGIPVLTETPPGEAWMNCCGCTIKSATPVLYRWPNSLSTSRCMPQGWR